MQGMLYKRNTKGKSEVYFDKSFYRGEFRCDFFVSSVMKRAWAEQIEILAEIDRICKKHNISYFADGGTLLGAVRHKGFIPWDDDLDIAMFRKDYNRFLTVCEDELKDVYDLLRPYERKEFNQPFLRVVNDKGLKKCGRTFDWCHGFRYLAGVDIFPLDYIAKDPEEFELQVELTAIIDNARQRVRRDIQEMNGESTDSILDNIEALCHTKFDREHNLEKQLGKLFDTICMLYREDECEEMTLFLWVYDHPEYRLKKEWYRDTILMDFEGIKIPVPIDYEEVLSVTYGNYMEFVRGTAAHEYPVYKKYKKAFEEEYCKKLCQEAKKTFAAVINLDENVVSETEVLKIGICNQTIRLQVNEESFVMRIAQMNRNHIIERNVEKKIYELLKLYDITDQLYVYTEPYGNKIVGYITNARSCDKDNWNEVFMCMQVLKYVHEAEISLEYSFDIWERIEAYENLWGDKSYYSDYFVLKEKVREMYEYVQKQEKVWGLTHFDPAPDNFLIFENAIGETDIRIIDWEYAGMQDTHMDIAMFALQAGYDQEQLDTLIDLYFGEEYQLEIRLKIYCYMSLGSLFYSNYYEYYDRQGIEMNEETLKFYNLAKEYYDIWQRNR